MTGTTITPLTRCRIVPARPEELEEARRCWLCGLLDPGARADVQFSPHYLCRQCWPLQPVSAHRVARSGMALVALLGLGRQWREGFRQGWTQNAAVRHRIAAWTDTGPTVAPPTERFGWITTEAAEAAAELEDLEDEFTRARRPPAAPSR
ncbi:hypothetical protein F0L17_26710 [Streptomyces sp. TRM43335]|uniref:Uncharacterized protein n=1 Tax=Streptomyces taklimakanensis TaxID=2569853 RepID=A0A6G2BL43_9ACTN|nr:hypothetical protein [Streptomyces taklimakanensis]MTE22622.1 hypothetical protein [Streptomyces taklimakanensis]